MQITDHWNGWLLRARRKRPCRRAAEGRDELASLHSITLMPADLITLAHLSVSSAMNFANPADVNGIGSTPRSASRAFDLGSARAAVIALLSLLMISAGVLLGAPRPYQPNAS